MRKAVAFAVIVAAVTLLVSGCSTSDMKTEVKGRQEVATTIPLDKPSSEVEHQTVDRDGVMEVLVNDVPALDGYAYGDIRSMLLDTVCDTIDAADGDFSTVGDVIVDSSDGNFDFTYSEAGSIVAAAVVLQCPEWADAALEFANSEEG